MLKSTARTADFLNRKMPASPFSVVMLHSGSLPWLHSPACLMKIGPLLLGEKPQTRAMNPICQFTSAEFNQESFSHLCPIILISCRKDVKVKAVSFSYHTKCKLKKKQVGLQSNCCQYTQTEMQFNSASNGWGVLSLCHCWEYRTENYMDGTIHIGTNNLN